MFARRTNVNGTPFDRTASGLVILANVGLIVALLAIGAPALASIRGQVGSGYVPPYFGAPWFFGFIAAPFMLAGLVALALVGWRRRTRKYVVLADAITVVAATTILLPYLLANELPVVALALALGGLLLAGTVALRERRRSIGVTIRSGPNQ